MTRDDYGGLSREQLAALDAMQRRMAEAPMGSNPQQQQQQQVEHEVEHRAEEHVVLSGQGRATRLKKLLEGARKP